MNLEHLPQLPPDKANHFLYGALASLAGVATAVAFDLPAAHAALGCAAVVGVAKEVWDKLSGLGDPDPWDVAATAAGGLPATLALWMAA